MSVANVCRNRCAPTRGRPRTQIRVGVRHRLAAPTGFTCAPQRFSARLKLIHDGIRELIERHRPDCVAVEDAFYAKNVRTTIALSQARGVILLAAQQAGVEIAEYEPRLVKKAVVGTGSALKPQVAYMVAQILRLRTPPEPADAEAPVVELALDAGDPVHVAIDVASAGSKPDYRVYAALVETGLSEYVRAGENGGKTLSFDEVVRAFAGPFTLPHAEFELKPPPRANRAQTSVVAFVQDEVSGDVVQAVRAPLQGCAK